MNLDNFRKCVIVAIGAASAILIAAVLIFVLVSWAMLRH